jgi:putative ABC transport system permease protein
MRDDISGLIKSVQGVKAVSAVRYFNVNWQPPDGEPQPVSFMSYNPTEYIQVASYIFAEEDTNPEYVISRLKKGDAILLSSVLSEKTGLKTGQSAQLRTRSGWRPFEIAGVVVDFYNQGMVIQGTWYDMQRYFRINDATTFVVKVEKGDEIEIVHDRIDTLYGERYQLTLESNTSIKNRVTTLMEQSSSTFDIMTILAVVVGALGVLNTLLMNVMERTKEIGMLRAIGMSRWQVVRMVLAEAGLMGFLGGILGLVTGIILARVLFIGMTTMSGYNLTFVLASDALLITVIVAFVVSQLASIIPSWHAAGIRILDAIHHE